MPRQLWYHALPVHLRLPSSLIPYKFQCCTCEHGLSCLQIGLMHGSFEKICPHKSTGRADYFGTLVNRAARLHSATKPGQILVEAPVMEVVLQQWKRNAYGSETTGRTPSPVSTGMTKGAALLQSGAIAVPDIAAVDADELLPSPRIKSAPQLLRSSSEKQGITESSGGQSGSSLQRVDSGLVTASAAVHGQEIAGGRKPWFARPPGGTKTATSSNRISKQGVTFGPADANDRPSTGLSKLLGPRRSTEGVSYDDAELDELETAEATCQPVAANSPLANSNCHMLKFLGQCGRQRGRKESLLGAKAVQGPGNSLTPLSGSPDLSSASLPGFCLSKTGPGSGGTGNVPGDTSNPESKRPSFLNPTQRGVFRSSCSTAST